MRKFQRLEQAVRYAVDLATSPTLTEKDPYGFVNINTTAFGWDVRYSIFQSGLYSIPESVSPEPAEVHFQFIIAKLKDIERMDNEALDFEKMDSLNQ